MKIYVDPIATNLDNDPLDISEDCLKISSKTFWNALGHTRPLSSKILTNGYFMVKTLNAKLLYEHSSILFFFLTTTSTVKETH